VAPGRSFDSLELPSQTSIKAGLLPDAWLDEDTEVQHFQAQIFA
jgi:AMMECR1 domain-containing protein